MTLERGKIVLSKKGKPTIERDGTRYNAARKELSQPIAENPKGFAGQEVEFEMVNGQPEKVRPVGMDFEPPALRRRGPQSQGGSARRRKAGQKRNKAHGGDHGREKGRTDNRPRPDGSARRHQGRHQRDFHNPYNFIPAPPRKTDDADLGDAVPVRQDRYEPDRFSGRIRVTMTAVTPLLVPDTDPPPVPENDHKTYALRTDADGKPLIPASSLRGMLRSAYEAITNSRFGALSKDHEKRCSLRMVPSEALQLIPARIEDSKLHLMTGTSSMGEDGSPANGGPMYAAWLPRYFHGKIDRRAPCYSDGQLPSHGDPVRCWLQLVQHHRWDRRRQIHRPDFTYWKVLVIRQLDEQLPEAPPKFRFRERQNGRSWHEGLNDFRQVKGWVSISNANINRKHDERVFFFDSTEDRRIVLPLTADCTKGWQELIRNYQEIHTRDLEQRRQDNIKYSEFTGPEPGKTAWSRHIYDKTSLNLDDGALCYVRLSPADRGQERSILGLYPVMISRKLHSSSPLDLIDGSLRPAEQIAELSPADRVFGWVRGKKGPKDGSTGAGAVRGQLRVGPVVCTSDKDEASEVFAAPGVPLAILAEPKPQQGRFYVAKTPAGEAQDDGLSKVKAGYTKGKGLRGRKVYPHQSLPKAHWDNPTEDRTRSMRNGHYQEYRRPISQGTDRDNQNHSILGWVKPGARFVFDLHVLNLSRVEFGALMWLLTLPEKHHLRYGGGKPLGFGSVHLTVESSGVTCGRNYAERFQSWESTARADDADVEAAIDAFKTAVARAYAPENGSFEATSFIAAFLASCRGFDDQRPTHYPRATQNGQPGPPNPEGKSFRWFVANEKGEHRYALGDLASDPGLPTLPQR